MTELIPSTKFEDKVHAASEAPNPDPIFVSHLRARLVAQAGSAPVRRNLWQNLAWSLHRPVLRVGLAALLIILVLTLAAGPEKVVAAVKGLVGYIPGFGFIDNVDTTLVLVEPVHVERDGITVTVKEAMANSNETEVILQIEGLPQQTPEPGQVPLIYSQQPYLHLPTGETLSMWASQSSTGLVAQGQYAFASLPSGIKDITLVLPHLPVSLDDPVYQNWEIPLHLQPASKDGKVSSSGAAGWSTPPIQGITLRLENVLAEPDRTVLQLALIPEDPQWQVWEWGTLHMEDQDGKIYPLIERAHSLQPITSRIFQTEAIDPSKHLTITLEGVKIRKLSPEVIPQSTVAPTIQLDGQWQISWHLE